MYLVPTYCERTYVYVCIWCATVGNYLAKFVTKFKLRKNDTSCASAL